MCARRARAVVPVAVGVEASWRSAVGGGESREGPPCVGVDGGEVGTGALSKLLVLVGPTPALDLSNQCGNPCLRLNAPGGNRLPTSPALTPVESHVPEEV